MKITLELDRIWTEDGLIDDHIVKQIALEVKSQLMKKHEEEFQKKVAEVVRDEVYTFVREKTEEKVKELLANTDANLGWPINDTEPKTLERHLMNAVEQAVGTHSNWNKYFKDMGSKLGKELKERYDREFAGAIVDSMVQNNMLKDDVVKMLMKKS